MPPQSHEFSITYYASPSCSLITQIIGILSNHFQLQIIHYPQSAQHNYWDVPNCRCYIRAEGLHKGPCTQNLVPVVLRWHLMGGAEATGEHQGNMGLSGLFPLFIIWIGRQAGLCFFCFFPAHVTPLVYCHYQRFKPRLLDARLELSDLLSKQTFSL